MTRDAERPKSTRFPDTPWSLLGRAAAPDDAARRAALDGLLRAYLPAMHSFVRSVYRLPADDCDELVQAFVTDKVLHAGLLAHADPRRGRFRNLLCKSLGNFASTWLKREHKRHARMPQVDDVVLEYAPTESVEALFDRAWGEGLVRDAIEVMRDDCAASGRTDLVEIFTVRVSAPLLEGAAPESYESLTARLQLGSPRKAINLLATAKRAYVRALAKAAGRYLDGAVEIDAELAELRAALAMDSPSHATSASTARSKP